ncbi:Centromere protein Mis12 [Macleaya cordata]|uniref:Centromere protein Mis12 n=1 Tax=Macleaya cordata TaxID=56857 RepID=A0A200QPW2_MACCD|nr:Centromere protein Mis12 [Macleaya cordata]
MEGTESEKVFDSLNLNPQLFINEVLNAVDDTVDGAFEFYEQQALAVLKDTGEDKSNELSKGISSIRNVIQEVLDKRMGMWEKYCIRHCFAVPEGFSLPKADTSSDSLMDQDLFSDAELDNQLDSLREKLYVVRKESAELQKELHDLKQQHTLSSSCAESVTEALQIFEQKSVQFEEMVRTATTLREKFEKMKIKELEEFERVRTERIYDSNKDQSMMHHSKGFPAVEFKDLQDFVADLKKM